MSFSWLSLWMSKVYQVCRSHTFSASLHCQSVHWARLFFFQLNWHFHVVYLLLILIVFYLQYVALKTALQADEVELYLVEEPGGPQEKIISGERTVDSDKDKLRVLGEQETLAELISSNLILGHLVNSQNYVVCV